MKMSCLGLAGNEELQGDEGLGTPSPLTHLVPVELLPL